MHGMWYDKVKEQYPKEVNKMYSVVALYPNGDRVLVGFAHSEADVRGLINDCIAKNGKEQLQAAGIRFCVEFAV